MSLQVHQEPLYRRYYAPWCSAASLYTVFFSFVLIILPLIIAYNSYDFWLKDDSYLEQPAVSYKYLASFQWNGLNRDGSYQQWQYSTNAYINQLNPAATRQPVLRSAGLDDNRDGKMDRLEVSVQLPLQAGESVSSFSALLYHDVQLSQRAKLLFDAVTFVNYESATPMGKLSVDGDMLLRQTWPLWDYGGYRRLYADDPLFDVTDTTAAQDVAISAVMRRYNARNVSMVLRTNYASVDRRDDLVDVSDGTLKYFNASLTLRVPLQSIVYTPPASAVLKFAWIQYVSFFMLVSFLLFSLNSFIYRHQLLATHATADVVHQKLA